MIEFNLEYAVTRFSELLIYETVDGNIQECERFIKALEALYPNIHCNCEFERVGNSATNPGGLIYRYKGKDSSRCIVLMSHFDVVPAAKDETWKAHPFSGDFSDDEIVGRGALDTKCTLCAIMESVETLLEQNYTPDFDIYMCFGGDEETSSTAAITMSALLKKRGVSPFLIVDEGGAI
ncbi:MAG: M20/M25/M40 family metallo-hydrolase, partial [Oscillospiraceae bacterium]|nr:M20/M25/M40 family metallo-hydrolase [Oscillospiraceae bacterium]